MAKVAKRGLEPRSPVYLPLPAPGYTSPTQVLSDPSFQMGDIGHLHDLESTCLLRSESLGCKIQAGPKKQDQHLRVGASLDFMAWLPCLPYPSPGPGFEL